MWNVEFTDEFGEWWEILMPVERRALEESVGHLMRRGPMLSRPHADTVKNSHHAHMKEL